MRKLFLLILVVLTSTSVSAYGQARKPIVPRLSIASRDFTVTNYGAVGDGQVLTNCSILNGSDHVICATGKFVAGDVGKVFALYGAGRTVNGFQIPLAGSIVAVISAYEAQLSVSAQAAVTNSERFVWGTNDTVALQNAVNAAADAGGGEVEIPSGHYLTEKVILDCAAIGNFPGYGYSQPCIRAYNGLSIRGNAALTTILENWNPDVQTINGLIDLGRAGEIPNLGNPNWPPKRLANIEISGLTLRQVKYPTRPIKIIYAYATEDVSVHDCYLYGYSYEGLYMGGGFKSWRWRVFNNVAYEIGKGGPVYQNTLSAYNLNGSYVEAFNNKASNCGQCFEAGSRHFYFYGNLCENSTHSFLIGSTGSGVWDGTISGNVLKNNYYALVAGNGNGTFHSLRFTGNTMIDTPDLNITGGKNSNTVNEVEFDSTVHGQTVISDNVFTFTKPELASRTIFRLFLNPTFADWGSDSYIIADNTITYSYLPTASVLQMGGQGGQKWEPGKAFSLNQPAVSSMWGAYWYKATVAGTTGATEPIWPQGVGQTVVDGGVTWLCMGARPQIAFSDNRVYVPANVPQGNSIYSNWPGAIRIDYGVREMLVVKNFQVVNTNWRMQMASADMHDEIIPRNAPYDDFRRYGYSFGQFAPATYLPQASFWQLGMYVQKPVIDADGVYGWIVTREGYAAPTYSATASYSTFGTFVKPTVDNGKVYQLIGGSCSATAEPVWPQSGTVTAGGCTWKAAANAARFTGLR